MHSANVVKNASRGGMHQRREKVKMNISLHAFLSSPPVCAEPTPSMDSTLSQRRQELHAEQTMPWGSMSRLPPRSPHHSQHRGRRRGALFCSHAPRWCRGRSPAGIFVRDCSCTDGARGGAQREWELSAHVVFGAVWCDVFTLKKTVSSNQDHYEMLLLK
jgi:hypothetical protein